MSNLRTLVFFATPAHDCSYLPGRRSTTLFVDPKADINRTLYSQLTVMGFRRSGTHYYRPHCENCQACIPVRVPVAQFKPDRNQRRVWKKNADVTCTLVPAAYSERGYQLYAHYIELRHKDGDMYPPSRDQFMAFLVEGKTDSWFLEMTLHGELIGLAAVDRLDDGLSAVYTVFAPDLDHRSLGTFAVLWQIEEAQRQQLGHVYLGYWILECRKMNYKSRFKPIEQFTDNRWHTLDSN